MWRCRTGWRLHDGPRGCKCLFCFMCCFLCCMYSLNSLRARIYTHSFDVCSIVTVVRLRLLPPYNSGFLVFTPWSNLVHIFTHAFFLVLLLSFSIFLFSFSWLFLNLFFYISCIGLVVHVVAVFVCVCVSFSLFLSLYLYLCALVVCPVSYLFGVLPCLSAFHIDATRQLSCGNGIPLLIEV